MISKSAVPSGTVQSGSSDMYYDPEGDSYYTGSGSHATSNLTNNLVGDSVDKLSKESDKQRFFNQKFADRFESYLGKQATLAGGSNGFNSTT